MKDPAKWITRRILQWSEENPRPMPWKETRDPYRIWVSEIILQQTRVTQGWPYYLAFVGRFPSVHHLARATEGEVLQAWQGLGYNSRVRNMLAAAQTIVTENDGVFPDTYEAIRRLKGIGDYTAAAISSFAFGISTPVLDSNVIRVLSRLTGISDDPSKRVIREVFYSLLGEMIKGTDPAAFNQAIMNFGAIQCTPGVPNCSVCSLSKNCIAFQSRRVAQLPAKRKQVQRKDRFFHYFVLSDHKGLILHQRTQKDIWQQMFDFPLLETGSSRRPSAYSITQLMNTVGMQGGSARRIHDETQVLTHQNLYCAFYRVHCRKIHPAKLPKDFYYSVFENLRKFAFPKVIRSFFSESLHLTKLPQGSTHDQ